MSIVTTNRPIDLAQLSLEVAAAAGLDDPPGLSMSDDGHERIVRCDDQPVTQRILDDCIDAHVPAPPLPTLDEQLASLQAENTALRDQVATTEAAVMELSDLVLFGGI